MLKKLVDQCVGIENFFERAIFLLQVLPLARFGYFSKLSALNIAAIRRDQLK
jgi:hypothetical protein